MDIDIIIGSSLVKYKITSIQQIISNSSLLLVRSGDVPPDHKDQETYKVESVAICKLETDTDAPALENVLVAFYIERGHLHSCVRSCVLDCLPPGYFQCGDPFFMVDYKSYCEITGEKKLSFREYCKAVKDGKTGLNTITIEEN